MGFILSLTVLALTTLATVKANDSNKLDSLALALTPVDEMANYNMTDGLLPGFNGRNFYIVRLEVDHSMAQSSCDSFGLTLVEFIDPSEVALVISGTTSDDEILWIGGRSRDSRAGFSWISGGDVDPANVIPFYGWENPLEDWLGLALRRSSGLLVSKVRSNRYKFLCMTQ